LIHTIGFDNFRYPQLERVWNEVLKDYSQEDLQTMPLLVQITATYNCFGPYADFFGAISNFGALLGHETASTQIGKRRKIPHTKPTGDKIKIQQQCKQIALTIVSYRDLPDVLEMEWTPLMGRFVAPAACESQDTESLSEARRLSAEGIYLRGTNTEELS